MSTEHLDHFVRPTASPSLDPTPVRFLASQGVDYDVALRIVEHATFEWQHGDTLVSPMRAAMEYITRRNAATGGGDRRPGADDREHGQHGG